MTGDVVPGWRAALAGAAAVGAALGLLELLAATTTRLPSAVDAVGQQVIPLAPDAVTRWAIATFGTGDVAVLQVGTTILALLLGAVVGVAARRGSAVAVLVFGAFGLLGLVAALADPSAAFPLALLAFVAAVGVGLAALRWLLAVGRVPPDATVPAGDPVGASGVELAGVAGHDRRRFLLATGGVAVAGVLAAATGRVLLRDRLGRVEPAAVVLPAPVRALPQPGPEATLEVEGLSPLFTPTASFYVIDTAVAVPQVDPTTWSLRVSGLVERELELTYDELLAEPLEELDLTLACVSNEVGGDLVGNARWLGTRIAPLLERAGVRPEGTQLVGRAVDGFTVGFPTRLAFERDAIVAVGMNGEPLPAIHGFPARLLVPGLYGYVSATKWVTELELAPDDFEAYWVPRGWAKEGPIKTQSRVDVPRSGAAVAAGDVTVAGIAYAPTRGISRVEVRVDGDAWIEAELSDPLSDATWVPWRARVPVAAGDHVVQVRATDGDGATQPEQRTAPAPDGAQGWHRVTFRAV